MRTVKRTPKARLTTADYAARFMAEAARQKRRLCDAFAAWRSCKQKTCRRMRVCRGDAFACLKRVLATTPRTVQHRAMNDILARTPRNFGGPERAVRSCVPADFCDGRADSYAIGELKRLRRAGTLIDRGDNVDTLRLKLVEAEDERALERWQNVKEDTKLARSLGLDLETNE